MIYVLYPFRPIAYNPDLIFLFPEILLQAPERVPQLIPFSCTRQIRIINPDHIVF
jgi:hypothetical protein